MKNNRTNRKLKFIREKNRIRIIGKIITMAKMTKEFALSEEFNDEYVRHDVLSTLKKKYKIVWLSPFFTFEIGQINDDFIRDLHTLQIQVFKNKSFFQS